MSRWSIDWFIMSYHIPLEIWQNITDLINGIDQVKLTMVCKDFHDVIRVKNFYNIDHQYKTRLTNEIIKNYPYLVKLDIRNYPITKIDHLKHLHP